MDFSNRLYALGFTVQKNIRYYIWLIKGIFDRYSRIILASFALALILIVIGVRYGKFIWNRIENDRQIIGVVGSFTPSNLPISIQKLISLGLTEVSDTGEVLPALATSWEVSDDGKKYTFHLRTDQYWHDAKKFTAFDVNYNLRDVEFVPINETDLVVKLNDAFTPLPSFLSKALFRKGLIGLGAYKIAAIKLKGDDVSYLSLKPMVANLPQVEVKFYASAASAKTAFKLGEINVLDEIITPTPFTGWKNVKVKENVKLNQFVGIFLNNNDDLLKSKELRQGLNFALEKPEKNRIATPISSKSWAYTNRVKQYEKDLDQAKKLLSDYVESSKSATLTLSTFNEFLPLAQTVAAAWTSLGVTTQVKVETGVADNYQALLGVVDIPSDPDQYNLWHSTQTATNISHYASPKIDKLLESGRKESDQEKREKIYFDFQRYLVEDSPAVFLFHPTTYTISR